MSTIIIDSGGTSSDWAILKESAENIQFSTDGLNPVTADIDSVIKRAMSDNNLHDINQIYLYGAGCSTPQLNAKVKRGLSLIGNDIKIVINSDLLGAAYALCRHKPGIVSILGTGSNTSVYDGQAFVESIETGGYLLGDEGSGFVIGKELLIRYLRDGFSKSESEIVARHLEMSKSDILNTVYTERKPNHLIASYASIFRHLSQETRDEIVMPLFNDFVTKRILPFEDHLDKGLFFCGSIAFHYRKELSAALNSVNLQPHKIIPKPIEALIQYHKEYV